MHASSAKEPEPIAAMIPLPDQAEPSSEKSSEMASDRQVSDLCSQVRILNAKATEVLEQAQKLEQEACGDEDAAHEAGQAKSQVATLRETADIINTQVNSAPTDKRGHKKLKASQVTVLHGKCDQAIHCAEVEKAALVTASSEAKPHSPTIKVAPVKTVAPEKPVMAVVRRRSPPASASASPIIPAMLTATHAPEISVVHALLLPLSPPAPRAAESVPQFSPQFSPQVSHHAARVIESVRVSVSDTIAEIRQSEPVRAVAAIKDKAVSSVKEFAKHPVESVGNGARAVVDMHVAAWRSVGNAVETHVVAPTVSVAKAAARKVGEGYDVAKASVVKAGNWVGEAVAEKKEWVMAMMPFSAKPKEAKAVAALAAPAPKPITKPAVLSAFDTLEKARKQALASLSAMTTLMDVQSMTDMFSFSPTSVPTKIHAALPHFSSLL